MTTCLIFLCFVSFLFNFSYARIPFQIYDIIDRANTNANTNSDPIEKPTMLKWEHHKTSEPKTEPNNVDQTQSSSTPLPLNVFSFDPRNPRHALPLRIRHRCHHYKPWKPRSREIPQRNNDISTRSRVKHMARGWTRFGHVHPVLVRQRGMDMETSELLRRHHHRRRHNEDEVADKVDDTSFVKRIRKFLNHF